MTLAWESVLGAVVSLWPGDFGCLGAACNGMLVWWMMAQMMSGGSWQYSETILVCRAMRGLMDEGTEDVWRRLAAPWLPTDVLATEATPLMIQQTLR